MIHRFAQAAVPLFPLAWGLRWAVGVQEKLPAVDASCPLAVQKEVVAALLADRYGVQVGITDAFLDAEGCAQALHAALAGMTSYDKAMAGYQSRRDTRAMPVYQLTLQIAALQPPDDQMVRLVSAIAGNQDAMDAFARLNSGVTSPVEFFAPENVGRILDNGRSVP